MNRNKTSLFMRVLTFFFLLMSLYTSVYAHTNACPPLAIEGEDRICESHLFNGTNVYDYEINYDKFACIRWEVENGDIVLIDGEDTTSFLTKFPANTTLHGRSFNPSNPGAPYTVKLAWCGNGSIPSLIVAIEGAELILAVEGLIDLILPFLEQSEGKKISVIWDPLYINHSVTAHIQGGGIEGVCGSDVITKIIQTQTSASASLSSTSGTNLLCTQGTQISGLTSNGDFVTWNTPGAVIGKQWGTGIYIDHFVSTGAVPVSVTIGNSCGTMTRTIVLNISPPDFGPVQQNGQTVGVVTPDCQNNFYLSMPAWVSNETHYTWELPYSYDVQTNTYSVRHVSGNDLRNVMGTLPANALTDFTGRVGIQGPCSNIIKTFTIRATQAPTVDDKIYSCTNTVLVRPNNPNGFACNYWSTNGGYFTSQSSVAGQFLAPGPGQYNIHIGMQAGSCYRELVTTVIVGAGVSNGLSAGWQSGVLSDNRQKPGSNLVSYNGNIYFAGRDGKVYYYHYNAGLSKWVINTVSGLNDVTIPAAGSFTKIGIGKIGTVTYLFYNNATNNFMKLDLTTNSVSFAIGSAPAVNDFLVNGSNLYFIQKSDNAFYLNTIKLSSSLLNASMKTEVPGLGAAYIQNNNLYVSGHTGALTSTNDVFPGSDVLYFNGYLYFARGAKGSANLYRLNTATLQVDPLPVTTSGKGTGVFAINPSSGVIYWGQLDPAKSSISTYSAGNYVAANIYQVYLQGSNWQYVKTTNGSAEGIDMLIHSALFINHHLYYVGAGKNASTAGNLPDPEVWNLYYESGCVPAVERAGSAYEQYSSLAKAYPNPCTTELTVDASNYAASLNGAIHLEVYEADGKQIYGMEIEPQLVKITTADWAAGMYVLKLSYEGTILSVTKVVKTP